MQVVLEKDFPNSKNEPFIKTSEVTPLYNYIAWAADDCFKWYEPDPFGIYYWPPNIPREYTIGAYIKVYESLGYIRCTNGNLKSGEQKIAIFAKDNFPTHAAKQLQDGSWSSKLGKNIDVSHTLNAIEHGHYGLVVQFLVRKIY